MLAICHSPAWLIDYDYIEKFCAAHVVQFTVEFFCVRHRLTWGARGNLY